MINFLLFEDEYFVFDFLVLGNKEDDEDEYEQNITSDSNILYDNTFELVTKNRGVVDLDIFKKNFSKFLKANPFYEIIDCDSKGNIIIEEACGWGFVKIVEFLFHHFKRKKNEEEILVYNVMKSRQLMTNIIHYYYSNIIERCKLMEFLFDNGYNYSGNENNVRLSPLSILKGHCNGRFLLTDAMRDYWRFFSKCFIVCNRFELNRQVLDCEMTDKIFICLSPKDKIESIKDDNIKRILEEKIVKCKRLKKLVII
jgi:hypothetical protein